MIPAQAVEAAAKAFIEHGTLLPALEAAAPYMLREAWDEGCNEGLSCNPCYAGEALAANPYKEDHTMLAASSEVHVRGDAPDELFSPMEAIEARS